MLGWVHLHKAAVVYVEAKEGSVSGAVGRKAGEHSNPASANHAFMACSMTRKHDRRLLESGVSVSEPDIDKHQSVYVVELMWETTSRVRSGQGQTD